MDVQVGYWTDPSVLLHYCLFHLMQFSLLFFSFVLIGRAHTTWRTLEGSGASSRIPGSFIFSTLSFTRTTPKSGNKENFFRQSSLDKRVAVCTLDEEVNDDNNEDQKRLRPMLIRGVLVKEESRDCQVQGQVQRNYRCQDSALPLSPGIFVNGFPL